MANVHEYLYSSYVHILQLSTGTGGKTLQTNKICTQVFGHMTYKLVYNCGYWSKCPTEVS